MQLPNIEEMSSEEKNGLHTQLPEWLLLMAVLISLK